MGKKCHLITPSKKATEKFIFDGLIKDKVLSLDASTKSVDQTTNPLLPLLRKLLKNSLDDLFADQGLPLYTSVDSNILWWNEFPLITPCKKLLKISLLMTYLKTKSYLLISL